jgi:hypothetical protein
MICTYNQKKQKIKNNNKFTSFIWRNFKYRYLIGIWITITIIKTKFIIMPSIYNGEQSHHWKSHIAAKYTFT